MKRFFLIAAAAILMGVGCVYDADLNRKVIDLDLFDTDAVSRTERLDVTHSIEFEDGLTLTLRPTYLGITGTVADIVGGEIDVTKATLDLSHGSVLDWTRTDRRETEASKEAYFAYLAASDMGSAPKRQYETVMARGRMTFERSGNERKMLLPAFWQEGDWTVEDNGVLWLTKDAHSRLKQGQAVAWDLGLGNPMLDTASGLLRRFEETAKGLFGGDDMVGTPFDLRLVTEDGLFAVRVDGTMETVEALQAHSWFADYLILDNADNPLILKISVNPVAASALDAFSPLGVDTKALGYEITEISR